MRITRLGLRNYRVFEDAVDLELPPGLVGIYGANGSGKSALLESITWALWGKARTAKELVRTSGVRGDCIAEVEFEHDGHLYLARRVITGVNSTVKALVNRDGMQVANGPRDTTAYVRRILGMDGDAFLHSVFAEQKQVAAFSNKRPEERRQLVLELLGIAPVDQARDQARKDARVALQSVERMRDLVPDVASLTAQLEVAHGAAEAGANASLEADAQAEAVAKADDGASAETQRLATVAAEVDALEAERKRVQAQRSEVAARVSRLGEELASLAGAEKELAEVEPDAQGVEAAEARLRLVVAVVEAEASLAAIPVADGPPEPDPAANEQAEAEAREARAAVAELTGRREGAKAEVVRAREAVGRTHELTGEAACPLCGQPLGSAFEQVR